MFDWIRLTPVYSILTKVYRCRFLFQFSHQSDYEQITKSLVNAATVFLYVTALKANMSEKLDRKFQTHDFGLKGSELCNKHLQAKEEKCACDVHQKP